MADRLTTEALRPALVAEFGAAVEAVLGNVPIDRGQRRRRRRRRLAARRCTVAGPRRRRSSPPGSDDAGVAAIAARG